mmetsp:Transcript_120944/g.338627  ORF Transcript_120944/g.338627 Transcript_120944/m.338627 type:complete len:162 (-) Transcript_120944:2021-2506(-)
MCWFSKSSACVPCSTTSPLSTTTILSAPITVDKRWAINITLQRPAIVTTNSSNDCCTFPSFSASNADVASSRRRSDGFLRSARAMDNRCFWPPLKRTPPSPIIARYPSSNFMMNSSALAVRAAATTSSSVMKSSLRPYVRFSLMGRQKTCVSCWTTPTRFW